MSTEIKVGALVLAGVIALGYFIIKIEDIGTFGEKDGYRVHVLFDNAAGLGIDDPVSLAGVSVGRVEMVQLTPEGKARATLLLRRGVQLFDDAVAVVGSSGMLGDRILSLDPGTPGRPLVQDGGTIVGGEPISVDQMVTVVASIARNLDRTTDTLSKVLGTAEGEASLRQILDSLVSITARLDTVLVDNRGSIDNSFGNLEGALRNMNELSEQLVEAVPALVKDMRKMSEDISGALGDNRKDLGAAAKNLKTITQRLDDSAADLQELMAKMNRGEGSIARLVNESETVDRLNEALDSVDDTLAAADTFFRRVGEARFTFQWRSEFYQRIDATKNYFGVRLEIGETGSGRGFEFHIVDDNIGGFTQRNITTQFFDPISGDLLHTTVERQTIRQEGFRFNALMSQRIKNLQIRGGILENQAGLGVDFFAARDSLVFTGEIWDLSRDPDPHVKLRLQWNLAGRFFITGGWDDLLREELSSYYIGGGYSFRQ